MPREVLLVGGNGGIGRALLNALRDDPEVGRIHATWHRQPPSGTPEDVTWWPLDVTDEDAIAELAAGIERVDWLINTVGWLHGNGHVPEKHSRAVTPEPFLESMRINALPSLLLAKHFRRQIKRSPNGLFAAISARLGSIGENQLGGWYSYRASKAALNMALATLAVEWRRGSCPRPR